MRQAMRADNERVRPSMRMDSVLVMSFDDAVVMVLTSQLSGLNEPAGEEPETSMSAGSNTPASRLCKVLKVKWRKPALSTTLSMAAELVDSSTIAHVAGSGVTSFGVFTTNIESFAIWIAASMVLGYDSSQAQ